MSFANWKALYAVSELSPKNAKTFLHSMWLRCDQKSKIRSIIWPCTNDVKGVITGSPGNNVFQGKFIIIAVLINNMYFLVHSYA